MQAGTGFIYSEEWKAEFTSVAGAGLVGYIRGWFACS